MQAERILMTADTVGGVWTYAVELGRALAADGVEVALATMGAPLSPDQRGQVLFPGLHLFESTFKLEWMASPWDDVARAGQWLMELEKQFAPDAIHLNQYSFGSLPFRAPALVTGHSCVLSWWRAVRGGDAPSEWDRYREEVRRGLLGAAMVVAPTRAMWNALDEHYGPLPLHAVIPNGRGAVAENVPKEAFIFASGRVWDEAKNIAALERAAEEVPWPVYIAGERELPQAKACATYLGKLTCDQMGEWMGRAAIYAAPALYEPFGLGILEAASSGCALVLGDIPSLRENWDGAAAFVPPRDSEELARVLRRLVDSAEERIGLAARARQRSSHFTVERMASGYQSAYAQLAGSHLARRLHVK